MPQLTAEQKAELNTRAAIHALHFNRPKVFKLESEKHKSERAAAENLNWIVDNLVYCYDKKKRPTASLLYALSDLKTVAKLTEKAAKLNGEAKDDASLRLYKKARKEAEKTLLECFGLAKTRDVLKKDREELILKMANLLCPTLDENLEPIGAPQCETVEGAAKKLEKTMGVSYKTAVRAWNEYLEIYQE